MDITYFDLCSMLKMSSDILSVLSDKVLVYTHGIGLEIFNLGDEVHIGVKWVWYQLGHKILKIKVSTVEAPSPYRFFVFAEFQEMCLGRILQ